MSVVREQFSVFGIGMGAVLFSFLARAGTDVLIALVLAYFHLFRSRFERAEMGLQVTKKFLWTGNGVVFRGSVQHLRVVFSGVGRTVAPRSGLRLSVK